MNNPREKKTATVVLWHGEYRNDGLERLRRVQATLFAKDCWLEGEPGEWRLVGEFTALPPEDARQRNLRARLGATR